VWYNICRGEASRADGADEAGPWEDDDGTAHSHWQERRPRVRAPQGTTRTERLLSLTICLDLIMIPAIAGSRLFMFFNDVNLLLQIAMV